MTRRLLLAAAAALLAAACTPMQWVRPGATPEQEREDLASCQHQAMHEAAFRAWAYRPMMPIVGRDALGRRFLVWPHGYYGDPFGDRFMEEMSLTNFCMRAKGYSLEPVKPTSPKGS